MWKKIWNLLSESITKAIDCGIGTQGAAIAFYTIFSIAPLLILVISLGNIFYSEELITGQVSEQLKALIGEDLMRGVQNYMESRQQKTDNILPSAIAILTMIIGATTVISQLKNALNTIWEIETVHIHSVWQILINRLVSFGIIIVLSLLLLISLLAESILSVTLPFFQQFLPDFTLMLFQYLSYLSTILFAVVFFTLVFKILPDVHAPWRDVITGAIFTTILFLTGKYLVGIFLTATGIDTTYKTAGSLVIFIIWVYYNVQIVLFGAIVTQLYTKTFGGIITPYRFVTMRNQ